MTIVSLKVGVWPGKPTWFNKILWLFRDEFGYPSELITKDVQLYPVVVVPYKNLIQNMSTFSKYIRKGGNILIVCAANGSYAKHRFSKRIIPVELGKTRHVIGHCKVLDKEKQLSNFFPKYRVLPKKRRDFNLSIMIKEVQVYSPARTLVEFETVNGNRYPLLVYGKTKEGGRFALITTNEDILECRHSYWGPLLYLAALKWCLEYKPFVRKWHWPNAKRMVIALTFDFETVPKYATSRLSKKYWWWHRSFDRLLLRLGIRSILKFLMEKDIPSTWFLLGSQAIYASNIVKKLASIKSVEIAGHGDVHPGIDKLGKRFDEDCLSIQKTRLKVMRKMIKSVIPVEIEGFRAPGLWANRDTLRALQENGFRWSSSSSPQASYPTRWFYLPYNPIMNWKSKHKLDLVEIPVIGPWDKWCPIHKRSHFYQDYLRELLEDFKFLYFVGGLQTLLIHPDWVAGNMATWEMVESFINKILRMPDVAFLSCGSICSSWVLRESMWMEASYDSDASFIRIQVRNAKPCLSVLVHIPKGYRVLNVLLNKITSIPFSFWKDLHSIIFTLDVQGDNEYIISLVKKKSVRHDKLDLIRLKVK